MATQEDFVIVSKKDLEKMNEALSKAKETIDAATALIGGGAPVKKERKPRATKEEMAARAATTEAPAPAVEEIKDTVKTEKKTAAPTKVAPKPLGKSPVPPKKANGAFAPSMPKH